MKSVLMITALLIFGFCGNLFAETDGLITEEWQRDGTLTGGDVLVEFQDLFGNTITSIQRGNTVQVVSSHDAAGPPYVGTCILVLPVNSSDYREIEAFQRTYDGIVFGAIHQFYIPGWIQIEGIARARVSVDGIGVGVATLEVTP